MNILKNFIIELDYIIHIYSDIENTYNNIKDKDVCIYKAYNKKDILTLIRIYACCMHIMNNKIIKHNEHIDIPNLIEYYTKFNIDGINHMLALKRIIEFRKPYKQLIDIKKELFGDIKKYI